ncbi:MAG: 5-formyltetrahydrofolate cyclo-ligase [Myxococcota bacterium]
MAEPPFVPRHGRRPGEVKREKATLRDAMRDALSRLPEGSAESAGQIIAGKIVLTEAWERAGSIALYSHLAGEVDTGPLWDAARRALKTVVFPRVVSQGKLEFARVDDPAQLRRGSFNILEPAAGAEVVPIGGDMLVLVPGLAFDTSGGRLGRGAGYYDRALAADSAGDRAGGAPRAVRFGIGFALQIVPSIPMERYDIRMDEVWTEATPKSGGQSPADVVRANADTEEIDPR